MNKKIFYSADYNNEDFTGLFDRIINIKFIRKNGESFTLRSDYEPVWEGGSLYFKTCQPKPAIRVQYTQYQSTMIQVDIFITNLNIIEFKGNKTKAAFGIKEPLSAGAKSGNTTNLHTDILSVDGNHITKAIIEMGYRGNFHRWDKERPTALMTPERLYKSFLDLEIPNLTLDWKQLVPAQSILKAQRRCTVDITWAAHTNNPPDRITQFHGYVGTTEAGFQPPANLALDSSLFSQAGQISRWNLFDSLNDLNNPIDKVSIDDPQKIKKKVYDKKKKKNVIIDDIINNKKIVYRNLFNGGEPFTLLEAYCFHCLTRRFVRSDIETKRNFLLEKAALEYSLNSVYPFSTQSLMDIKKEIEQKVYLEEKKYAADNFIGMNGNLSFSAIAPTSYQESLNNLIDKKMIELYTGARYTIKNLPEYRKLYSSIRSVLKTAFLSGTKLSWADAAEQAGRFSTTKLPTVDNSVKVTNTMTGVREFILNSENGKYKEQDCYFENGDWILPTQNSDFDIILKDSKQKDIIFYPPTKISATGFLPADKTTTKKLRCFSGLFEVADAYMFGVPVFCTEKASQVFKEQQAGKTFIDFIFFTDINAQVEWICRTWNLTFTVLHNGGFCIKHISEDERSLASQDFVTNQSSAPFRIPAVYDVTLSPVRKIRMPFIAFLNPMQLVEWNSTSAIGEMVSFYYQPEKGRNFFMSFKSEIDFATVDDYNTMILSVTDAQYKDTSEVPAAVLTQENKKTYIQVVIIPDEQMDTWQKIYESPVGSVPIELFPLWEPTGELTENNRIPGLSFLSLMQSWNSDLFFLSSESETGWSWPDSSKRIDKKANKLYGKERTDTKVNFPDITFCLPQLVDNMQRIILKFPLFPSIAEYSNIDEYNDKYVLLYEKGVWGMELKETVRLKYQI